MHACQTKHHSHSPLFPATRYLTRLYLSSVRTALLSTPLATPLTRARHVHFTISTPSRLCADLISIAVLFIYAMKVRFTEYRSAIYPQQRRFLGLLQATGTSVLACSLGYIGSQRRVAISASNQPRWVAVGSVVSLRVGVTCESGPAMACLLSTAPLRISHRALLRSLVLGRRGWLFVISISVGRITRAAARRHAVQKYSLLTA
ncbi:hypothetical protein BGW36DRAFT_170430 [Talaromyces proteolyticus]|uniref:Uncharacterized protein n=1 Tax=Talaromyces proteolyticus TaxID=1131652 RepID=A0AAD4KVF8_9EURO|nr:uncharacterized protein BGW36DRAFT_170430 [Talaromyces proteolyticus]KAH8697611.1 hypothetical protein BGW36DRAFT_170430 [Talaromyces proteolyticus]